jgi:hypothetical protein
MFNQLISAMVARAPIDSLGANQPHLYWRIFCIENFDTTNSSGDSYSAIKIEFRGTSGGPNMAVGGTPIASSTFPGYPITNAFDDNDNTLWSGDNFYNPSVTGWVSYQFTSPVVINEILWKARNDSYSTQSVKLGRLEYSDNGLAWRKAWEFESTTPYARGEARIFTKPE